MGFLLTPEENPYPDDPREHLRAGPHRAFNEGAKAQLKKTLISIGKEARRMDNTTYLVPDYSKYRQAVKEAGNNDSKRSLFHYQY